MKSNIGPVSYTHLDVYKRQSSKGAIKVSGNENTIYYYKIRAIKEKQTQNSAFSEEISSTTLSAKTISDRLGNNSLYEYESVSTPNGTGSVSYTHLIWKSATRDILLMHLDILTKIIWKLN